MTCLRAAGCVEDGLVRRTRWCLGGEGRRRRPDYRSGRSGGRVRGPLGACSLGVGRRECVLGTTISRSGGSDIVVSELSATKRAGRDHLFFLVPDVFAAEESLLMLSVLVEVVREAQDVAVVQVARKQWIRAILGPLRIR